MPDDYRISDLSTAPSIGNSDLMELSVVNTASETGYTSMKAPVLNLANKIVNATQYVSDLQTQNKTITGAINEIAQGGGGGGGDADIVKTASGNPCSFSTSFAGELKSLTADIVCGGGNGTPDNPIPIVGHSELNLTRCGANFLNNADILSWQVYGNNLFSVDSSGNLIVETQDSIAEGSETQFISLPAGTYTLAIDNAQRLQVAWGGVKNVDVSNTTNIQFTLTEFRNDIHFKIICSSYPTNVGKIRITLGSNVKPYAPYNGQTYTIAFGQTVYGGVYDKSGRLTITHGYILVDENTPTLQYNGSISGIVKAYFDCTDKANGNLNIISDKFETSIDNEVGNVRGRENTNGVEFLLPSTVTPTTEGVKQWFADNNTQLAFELATPIVIDVPSISVYAEKGVNNIVSDCGGDVDVEYYTNLAEDIKDFIGDGVEVGDLANVEITTPSNNQVLKYDATSQKWVNGNSSGGSTHNYSTTEQVVGTWVDGSPVYEKTFVVNNPSTGNNTITHNISNLDMLISIGGFAKMADGYQQPFNFISNADDFKWNILVLDFGSTDFTLQIGVNYTSTKAISKAVVTLRYTKSTS